MRTEGTKLIPEVGDTARYAGYTATYTIIAVHNDWHWVVDQHPTARSRPTQINTDRYPAVAVASAS